MDQLLEQIRASNAAEVDELCRRLIGRDVEPEVAAIIAIDWLGDSTERDAP
jgi:hypothetical protein